MHEAVCGYGPALPMDSIRCRKCLIEIPMKRGIDTFERRRHENMCRGSDLANRTCALCKKVFEAGPTAHQRRAIHEENCRNKLFDDQFRQWFEGNKEGPEPVPPALPADAEMWVCKCWYVVRSKHVKDLKSRHLKI